MAQPRKFPQFPLSSPLTGNELVLLWQGLGNRRITLNTLSNFLGGGGAVGSSIYVDVRSFGTVGDGVVDDTEALQTAIDTANGRWIYFHRGDIYKITDTLNLPVGTKIFAYGAKVLSESHIYMLECQGDNIIEGLEIEGAGAEEPNNLGRGVNMVGSVSSYKSGLKLEDCYIHDVGFYGVYLQFVENALVKGTSIINTGYTGFMVLSGTNIHGEFNHIKGITGVGGEGYNVSFTRGSTTVGDNLTDNPRSVNCSFSRSLIEDNILWKGLDTHAGDSITFDNNFVLNCAVPVGIVPGNMSFAPKNCKVTNNTLQSGLGLNAGVLLSGVIDAEDLANPIDTADNCHIIGNTFIECGITNNAFSGGVRIRDTKNTVISNNHFIRSKVTDIGVQNTNYNFSILGNTCENVNAPSGFLAYGIHVTNPHNTGIIGGNTFERNDPSLNVNVGDRTIRLNPSHISTIKVTLLGDHNSGFLSEAVEDGDFVVKSYTTKGGIIKGAVTITTPEGSANEQLRFNHVYRFFADNTGVGASNNRLWLSGPAGGSLYFAVRSGTPLHLVEIGATNVNLIGATRSIGTFRSEGESASITGNGGSGNSLPLGLQSYTFTDGLSNNYPTGVGTGFRVKMSNDRSFEFVLNTTGTMWIRSLHTTDNNIWKKVITDFDIQGWYSQTSDPEVLGAIWNNGGVLTFSAGPIV
jgi:hypothetical protein